MLATTHMHTHVCMSCVRACGNMHKRRRCLKQERMSRLARECLLGQLTRISLSTFEHCLAGKATRKPLEIAIRASVLLQLIHYEICGQRNMRARHGAPYFITFIDRCAMVMFIWFLKSKALDYFRCYVSEVKNQLDNSIKALRTYRNSIIYMSSLSSYVKKKEFKVS